ncbi:LytTR family DNA-binding domain-containing protein [Spongiimicrobium sp. 2-473A-2-J]|uniref:LytTR family DNA-binding domain-containing protein n=1 Tax=Eudoraea algarum TaxID=3417568 RepID=UPI003D367AD9
MKTRNFIALTLSMAMLLALLIYWREYQTRDQVALFHVLAWQIGIWAPWILGFKLMERIIAKTRKLQFGIVIVLGSAVVWVVLHYGWFFFLSSTISPYLNLPGSRFGVYRYFFIFWTLIDIGLMWFVIDKLWKLELEETAPPVLFELTRGNNKYFCSPAQIHLLAAENYYTRLFTSEGVFVMRKPLKYFHDLLPTNAFRKIHRSTIINVNQVSELAKGNDQGLEVIMKDGTRRRVSRSYVKEITQFFKDRTY